MVTYRGYKTEILYVAETSYATGGSLGTAIEGKLQTITINQSNNLIRTSALGEGRNEVFVGWGNYECTFSIDYEISAFDFLQFGFGPKSGSGTTASPYYIEEADFRGYTGSAIPSFKLQVAGKDVSGGTDNVDIIIGAVINSVSISLTLGDTVKCSVECLAQKCTTGTGSTGSYSANTTKPWIYAFGSFNWDDTDVGRVQSITVNINNNFDPEAGREIGSRFTQDMEPGLRKYDWTAVVKMTSTIYSSLIQDFQGGTTLTDGTTGTGEPSFKEFIMGLSEGDTSGYRKAQIKLSDCAINDISKPINIGENIVEVTLNGTAKNGTTETSNRPIKWWDVT